MQYEIYWVNLDPTQGSEISKTRPCVVISPDDLNTYLNTIIIAPLTSTIKSNYPWRTKCIVNAKAGVIAIDQLRTIDRSRLVNRMGKLTISDIKSLKESLKQMLVD
jgi:mRNA interferase MazF